MSIAPGAETGSFEAGRTSRVTRLGRVLGRFEEEPVRGAHDVGFVHDCHLLAARRARELEGRQGVGARTLLASPFVAAASAIAGQIADPREML